MEVSDLRAEWPTRRLGDLIEVKHGFAFKGEFFSNEPTAQVLATPGSFAIGGGYQEKKLKFYDGPVPEGYVLKGGDVMVTMTDLSKAADTLGYAAIVPSDLNYRLLHNQRVGLVECKNSDATAEFIHWVMRTRSYRHTILGSASGSTVKHTAPTRIYAHEFRLPPIDEQRRIAAVLGALDDKIELNRKMNRTLEEMAQAIFKSWFIDFDGVDASEMVDSELGPIPKGWKVATLESAMVLNYGKSLPQKQRKDGDMPVYGSGGVAGFHNEALVNGPGIVVGRKGSVGTVYWVSGPFYPIDTTFFVEPTSGNHWMPYLHRLLERMDIQRLGADSAVPGVNRGTILAQKFVMPTDASVERFADTVEPFRARTDLLDRESRTLANLRDTLLPKLISGEIRVPAAEKTIEAHL